MTHKHIGGQRIYENELKCGVAFGSPEPNILCILPALNMDSTLISILMPVKNAARFLDDCLISILKQREVNWELVAVNDHSSDDSLGMLQKFGEQNKNVTVLDNKGSGIPDALITAYETSQGEFITRMDADDVMPEKKLVNLLSPLKNNTKKLISLGLVEYFSVDDMGDGYRKYADWLNRMTSEGINFTEIYRECSLPSCAFMVRRSNLEADGLLKNLEVPEDYDLCFRFYEHGYKILPVNQVVHLWRDHPNRTSRTDQLYNIRSFGNFKMKRFLALENMAEKELCLWGAGKKGKDLAKYLGSVGVNFTWITGNTKKQGNQIHGFRVFDPQEITFTKNKLIAIVVSNPDEQKTIGDFLDERNMVKWKDYFFFF
ncbi:MAG: glycosyltransferase family 2 protein [Vicingaceae bacterium]